MGASSCRCWEGLTKRPALPMGNSCEELSKRQMKNRGGTILPNNSGQSPTNAYDMESSAMGNGAFGTVRKAKNKKTGKVCAMKMIKKAAIANMDAFINEVDINTRMDHPNIVRLYETFEDHHQVYLAMEVCEGGEMFDRIIEQRFFSEGDAAVVIQHILSAVYYMHVHGIAHRDLKPENFLLKEKNLPVGQSTVKVIDFGIAKSFQHKPCGKGADSPCMKTLAGTAYYIAPEVLGGNYSEKCDVWSIGVILYILLCGSPPFAGETDQEIMLSVRTGRISFDLGEFNDVSKEAKQLILTMCTLRVKDRPSAGEVLNSAWVQQRSRKADSAPVSSAVIGKLKAFSAVNRFKKAALHVIAYRLDDQHIAKLRDTFVKLDGNGDGMLTLAEMKDACKMAELSDLQDVQRIFEQLDVDGSGSIEYTEFLAGMIDQKNYLQEELCWEAFRTFDRDGSGQIDLQELKDMLKENDEIRGQLSDGEAEQIFANADKDGDAKISFSEFMAMLRGS